MFNSIHTRGVTDGDDFVAGGSDDEIVGSIRARYIRDASVGIVLLGNATWSRRFVDWEIAAAIDSQQIPPLPLVLFDLKPSARSRTPLPPRLTTTGGLNLGRVDASQSERALACAIGQAMAHAGTIPREAGPPVDPLLRCDLD